jgi:hypothetical protein
LKTYLFNSKRIYFYLCIILFSFLISNIVTTVEAGYIVGQIEIDKHDMDKLSPDGGAPMTEVAPGKSGAIQIPAKIKLIKYPAKRQPIYINMWAHTDKTNDVWGASVNPKSFIMQVNELEKDIFINVRAPPYESVMEIRNITVGGDWAVMPGYLTGDLLENKITVRVAPYIHYNVFPIEGFQRVWPGTETTFKVGIFNFGNRDEEFHVSVINLESLDEADYAVFFPINAITVPAKSEKEFEFTVVGTVKNFHPWRSHLTTISLRVTPTQRLPQNDAMEPEHYAQVSDYFYYEFGPSFPEPCAFLIIIGIVILVVIYYFLKKGSKKRRKRRKLERHLCILYINSRS